MTRIALLDWDGTLRRGFTIIPWMEYLADFDMIASDYIAALANVFIRYEAGDISHDQTAIDAGIVYAKALNGRDVSSIREHALKYVREVDREDIFPWTFSLFKGLHGRGIMPWIVSGGPREVIEVYAEKQLAPCIVHAMSPEVADWSAGQVYTGRISHNPGIGIEKERIVLSAMQQGTICLGAGNSRSDLPLLRAAQVQLSVDAPTLHGSAMQLSSEIPTSLDIMWARIDAHPEE